MLGWRVVLLEAVLVVDEFPLATRSRDGSDIGGKTSVSEDPVLSGHHAVFVCAGCRTLSALYLPRRDVDQRLSGSRQESVFFQKPSIIRHHNYPKNNAHSAKSRKLEYGFIV